MQSKRYFIFLLAICLSNMSLNMLAQIPRVFSESEKIVTIGDAFLQAGNTKKALSLYEDAVNCAKTPSDKWAATSRLANIYIENQDFEKALQAYTNLQNNSKVMSDPLLAMYVNEGFGVVYYHLKNYMESIRHLNLAENFLNKNGKVEFRPLLYNDMAKTLILSGDVNRAGVLIEMALQQIKDDNDINTKNSLLVTKAELKNAVGKHNEAYDILNNLIVTKQVVSNNRSSESANSQTATPTVHRNSENELKLERHLQQARLDIEQLKKDSASKSLITYIVGMAVLLVILLLIWALSIITRERNTINMLTRNAEDKNQVLSIIAHDLMNPFNTMLGFSSLQLQYAKRKNDSELLDYTRAINDSMVSCYQLVSNLLAWSRNERQMNAKMKIFDIASEIDSTISVTGLMAKDKGINLITDIEENVQIEADIDHFNIIIRNLICNAIKFTPAGGTINVNAHSKGDKVFIEIRDNGIGMTTEKVNRFMENRSLGTSEGTKKEQGTGLGLFFCRDLIVTNNGKITLESQPNEGSKFTIIFKKPNFQ